MKYQSIFFITFTVAVMFGGALTMPAEGSDDMHAETLRLEAENNGVDKYSFAYETSNGISRTEEGELKTTEEGAAIVVHGTTSWVTPDGKKYEISFTADETGYHPTFKLVA